MATIKHIASKNANYGDAERYLTFQHDEFSMKPVLDEYGHLIPREAYLFEMLLCGEDDFAIACMKSNLQYHKNTSRGDIKSHHYIISFDPRDGGDHGLTMEKAQALGVAFCREHFPGHQAIVCTHPDGHNKSGNIHCHIVINSLRIRDVPFLPYMDRPCDTKAGMKHRCTASALRYFRSEVMEMCHREGLYQIDLLGGRKDRITEREYWAKKRGQANLDQKNERQSGSDKKPSMVNHSTKDHPAKDIPEEQPSAEKVPVTKFETDKEKLRREIHSVLGKAVSFEEFSDLLLRSGITVKESRGRLSYLTPDRTKPITSRRLGDDYSKEAVMVRIAENAEYRKALYAAPLAKDRAENTSSKRKISERKLSQEELDQNVRSRAGKTKPETSSGRRTGQPYPASDIPDSGLKKVVDIEAKKAAGYGIGYEKWAKSFNLKQQAEALYLYQEYGFESPEHLEAEIDKAYEAHAESGQRLKEIESALKDKKELRRQLMNYRAAKDIAAEYKSIKSEKKRATFYEEHRAPLMLREAAERYFREHGLKQRPKTKDLNEEINTLISEKNACYNTRREAYAREKELKTIKGNLESLIGEPLVRDEAEKAVRSKKDDRSL